MNSEYLSFLAILNKAEQTSVPQEGRLSKGKAKKSHHAVTCKENTETQAFGWPKEVLGSILFL